ncbi:MAG: cellobiose phosphorylase [Bacilli bacterium]|nr:cellobiose phosphorylase [Bacilli bacterium]
MMKNNAFIIKDYDKTKPFASFLPGIAGRRGIPLWCHYTNRSQLITSFGLRDKNGGILEFYPANTAYRIVDKMGFRTFIKVDNKFYEAFKVGSNTKKQMLIYPDSVEIEEINNDANYKINVKYFVLPNENIAGLVRRVKITNLGADANFLVADGITQLLPTDANEWMLKHQSNLLKSWMDVRVLKEKIGFYYETSIPGDNVEVKTSKHGNYYVSFVDGKLTKTIYDMNVLFGYDTSLMLPINFIDNAYDALNEKKQVAADKVSGGFSLANKSLKQGESIQINTIIGYTEDEDFILNKLDKFSEASYFDLKENEAREVIESITNDIESSTNLELFDNYMKQNYLDNVLRGGIPYFIDTKSNHFVYHLYSRRHGDMEREYNFYSIAPEFYSQGNGNFRDVCQNRRSDNLFHPGVGIFNAKMFSELIQIDGYNPLGVSGLSFKLKDKTKASALASQITNEKVEILASHLEGEFTPGSIANLIEREQIKTKLSDEDIFKIIFNEAISDIKAEFGEGYWIDHWTYILDLVENVEAIEPDKINDYLFLDNTYRFYDSPVSVLPRSEKYCLREDGLVRQYGALLNKDYEKIGKCKMNEWGTNWLKYQESDELVYTNLYSKLFSLAINKFSLLDPMQIGISMDANKPGWNDAMNGLPGIFASGVSETIELARLVKFLKEHLDQDAKLPIEQINLIKKIIKLYENNLDSFTLWDKVQDEVELFRDNTRFGVSKLDILSSKDIKSILDLISIILDKGINEAIKIGDGIIPTFLSYEVSSYTLTGKIGNYKLPTVKENGFNLKPLPLFLEGPARSYKYIKDKDLLVRQFNLIKDSDLYDKLLNMYKTSVDLDKEPYEIGRIRAFQKGWLERESNFLHMSYKYLLGLLKAGLYEEFFGELKHNFTCFMDPSIYGRSIYENSSFIATSNNPDPDVWGEGFVARLSGSTAEALSIWNIMMFGSKPFVMENNKLVLNLKPVVSKDFIKPDSTISAKFLSKINVTYHFDHLDDSYKFNHISYMIDGKLYDKVDGILAQNVRDAKVSQIDVYLK